MYLNYGRCSLPVGCPLEATSKRCSCCIFIFSSQSNRLVMYPLAFSNAVASHPIVSFPSALFFSIHSLSISRIISSVLVLLFIRNLLILSTEKPSSSPRWKYSVDTLSATASRSSGKTFTFSMRVIGCSSRARIKNGKTYAILHSALSTLYRVCVFINSHIYRPNNIG